MLAALDRFTAKDSVCILYRLALVFILVVLLGEANLVHGSALDLYSCAFPDMRLLYRKDDGSFGLTKDFLENIPPYAILSHTWGADTEEVTYTDLIESTGENKLGYAKLNFCAEQAKRDGLSYFWVDTCCIDKSSSAELTEAINSMFRWYRNADICYVYMSDVSTPAPKYGTLPSLPLWESQFRKSRWFTRGWTLQELIAPASVHFFSSNDTLLGGRTSLVWLINDITGIASQALRGDPLNNFSVEERMSWISKRTTTRTEDMAYCLLGIFDVHMPLIYGEGDKAFARLKYEISRVTHGK